MILTELTTPAAGDLPLDLLKDHLRLGSGFAEDSQQDALLTDYLYAAIAAIEGRTGCVLLQKQFSWGLTNWRYPGHLVLPVRPVVGITSVILSDQVGATTTVDAGDYRLEKDDLSPKLVSNASCLPSIPANGSVEVRFDAGYGTDWADVPADLGRAALILAADFYNNRASRDATALPSGVLALLERFRPIRVFGGV